MILTPMCPEWEEFQSTMHAHLNFQDAWLDDESTYSNSCDSTYRITRNVLNAHFPEFDVKATLNYFKKSGWRCDCQVYLESPEYLGKTKVEKELGLIITSKP